MTPEEFIQVYEKALATQNWDAVEPLIHENAAVKFSNGAVYKGKSEVQKAFEGNFAAIQQEEYSISNVTWVNKTDEMAVFMFDFKWTGIVEGQQASGSGRGSGVLTKDKERWQLLAENLSKRPS